MERYVRGQWRGKKDEIANNSYKYNTFLSVCDTVFKSCKMYQKYIKIFIWFGIFKCSLSYISQKF